MTETNQAESLYETDAHLTENIDELTEFGYNIIHEDEINIVATIANGEEYQNILKATGLEATPERIDHLNKAHNARAQEILLEDVYTQASGSAQIVVIEK